MISFAACRETFALECIIAANQLGLQGVYSRLAKIHCGWAPVRIYISIKVLHTLRESPAHGAIALARLAGESGLPLLVAMCRRCGGWGHGGRYDIDAAAAEQYRAPPVPRRRGMGAVLLSIKLTPVITFYYLLSWCIFLPFELLDVGPASSPLLVPSAHPVSLYLTRRVPTPWLCLDFYVHSYSTYAWACALFLF